MRLIPISLDRDRTREISSYLMRRAAASTGLTYVARVAGWEALAHNPPKAEPSRGWVWAGV